MSATNIIINDETPRRQYVASSGQVTFDFPFPFFLEGDLTVYLTPAGQVGDDTADLLTLTTDYTVNGADTQNGGEIVLNSGAATGDIITIERVVDVARTADYQTAGDFLAETLNQEQDLTIMMLQQLRSEIDRVIRRSSTSTSDADLTLPNPEANYAIGWNAGADALVNFQAIGTYQGTDTTTTTSAYAVRDLVKSTTAGQLDNVYICIQDSPAGTLLTNTSYWALIIDAVSAATSATNAAASETAAATSETNAAASETAAEAAQTAAEAAQVLAETAQTATEAVYDAFDDRYLGAKASDPTLDNDGNTLLTGALHFNTTDGVMKAWNGSAWVVAYTPSGDYLLSANNLSDITNAGTARTNLGLAIGTDVQAYDADTLKADVADTLTAPFRGTVTTDNDLSFDMSVTNNFTCTPTGNGTLTFTNITAGQSGNIYLNNSGAYAISAATTTLISAGDLTKLSTTGAYFVSYYSADGTNVAVSVSSAVTSAGA